MKKLMICNLLLTLILGFFTNCTKPDYEILKNNSYKGGQYYIATWGDDENPGTYEKPFATLQKAINMSQPGDTTYIRGGVYHITKAQSINPSAHPSPLGTSGTAENPIHYFNYPGEEPIFDASGNEELFPTGIHMDRVQYIKFRGITVRNVFQNTIHRTPAEVAHGFRATTVANITYERVTVHDVNGRGWWQSSGAWKEWDGQGGMDDPVEPGMWEYDTTRWINCDASNLFDLLSSSPGNAADGWKTISYHESVYSWDGCRAWHFSDDGIDPSGNMANFYVHNSWFMATDKYEDYSEEWNIEANGIKFAAPVNSRYFPELMDDTIGVRIVNCILAFNKNGIYNNILYSANHSRNNAQIYNNTAYQNGINYRDVYYHPEWLDSIWSTSVFINNLAYKSTSYFVLMSRLLYFHENNVWKPTGKYPGWVHNTDFTLNDAAFTSVDSTFIMNELTAPRKADGSLPDITWARLVPNSDMKGAGSYVGMSANPDIGVDWDYLDRTQRITFFEFPLK